MRNIFILLFFCSGFGLPLQGQQQISLEDLLVKHTFRQETVMELRSMKDGLHYTVLEDDNKVMKYTYRDGKQEEVLFDLSTVNDAPVSSFSSYEFSEDETRLLLTTKTEPVYRRSFTAEYYIWNSVTRELTALSAKGRQQVASFSPDGERVAFVRGNNLFVKSLKFGTESQVTFDGKRNEVINGIPDWVYEEEFSYNKAYAWSPDSRFLAYTRFDESRVREFSIPMYKGKSPELKGSERYPSAYTYKYPKAGEDNAKVSVHVYEIKSKTSVEVDLGETENIYVPRLKWTADGEELAVMRMNRRQDELRVLLANPFTGDSRLFYTEKNDRYIAEDFLDDFIFLPGNDYFVVNSERNGYSHLYLYNRQGFLVRRLTEGDYDVTGFYGYDDRKKIFYYQAAKESPLRREVYYVSLDRKKQGRLSSREGTNSARFSAKFQYYINEFTNLSTPRQLSLHDSRGKLIRVLEDNRELQSRLSGYRIGQKEFFSFTTSEGISLNGWMIKPVAFDPAKKYPVVMIQYSGPNSQEVLDEWSVGWEHYLAQEGFLVACVDPRGTGARGEDFRKVTYLQLGRYESDDQIEAARYLGSLPYADQKNIAIWGWSYGGFTVLNSMSRGGTVFKAGIAVAPLTHHKFYDTVYTERYMRTPKENPDGYHDNTPMRNPEGIKGRLLIIHGTADDNVHLQNTLELTEELVQAGVQFDMAIYTNRNHSIYGGNTRMHLYRRMTDFLISNLQ
ncbi:MAG: S9 family peptidase [Mangrovibacterium sp.]